MQAAIFGANHNLGKYVKPLPGLEMYSLYGHDTPTPKVNSSICW